MKRLGITGRLAVATLLVLATARCGGDDSDSLQATTSTAQTTTTLPSTTSPAEASTTTSTTAPPATRATQPPQATPPPKPTTTTAPRPSNTQFFISTLGCKNRVDFIRLDVNRRVTQSKSVLNAASNLQLIPLSERDDRLLFTAFNCDTKGYALYDIALTDPNASPRLIPSNLNVIDADYDYKTKAILVLTSQPDYTAVSMDSATLNQTVRWKRPASWSSESLYPQRLRALTGGEMMIAAATAGTGSGGRFVVARVAEDGTTYGGVTGDGRIQSFDISILQEQIALSFESSAPYDIYLCSFNQVYGANTATPIASTRGCSGSRLPPAGIGFGSISVGWAFGSADNRLLLLAARGETYALDVEHIPAMSQRYDPPAVYGTTKIDGLTVLDVTSVNVIEKDLHPTLPGVSL